MTFPIPDWAPAEPGVAPALSAPRGAGGRVVAVVGGASAYRDGWAGEVTVDLARAWSAAGARLVLADGGLTHARLHETLGIPLGEGLVDALRWGASVKRVATRPAGHAFFVITAGTAVADTAPVLESPRWVALCAGFREAGVTLAVLVPGHDSSRAGILAQATEAVVLAGPNEDVGSLLEGWEGPVMGVVGREPAAPPPVLEEAPEVAEEAPGAVSGEVPEDWAEGTTEEAGELLAGWDAAPEEPDSREPDAWEPAADAFALEEAGPADSEPAETEPPEPEPPRMVSTEDLSPWSSGEAEEEEPEEGVAAEDDLPAAEVLEAEPPPAWDEGDLAFTDDVPDDLEDTPPLAGDEDAEPLGWDTATPAPEAGEEAFREAVPTFEEIVEEASEEPVAPARGPGRTRMLLLVLLLVALGAVTAALLGYVRIPGITPLRGGAAEAPEALPAGPTIAAPPPSEAGEPLPFSLALGAFQDEAAARSMAEGLAAQVPGVLFVIAPVTAEGAVLHRVLAGPAADSAAAAGLSALVAGSSGMDASGWAPRATPKAFQLGEMPELEAARRRAEVLHGLGIPAYVLAVPFSDGSLRFRVYAGAYADEAEASYLSGLLDERGLNSASLSDRIGRLPE